MERAKKVELVKKRSGQLVAPGGFRTLSAMKLLTAKTKPGHPDVLVDLEEWAQTFLGGAYPNNLKTARRQIGYTVQRFLDAGYLAMPHKDDDGRTIGIYVVWEIPDEGATAMHEAIDERVARAERRRDLTQDNLDQIRTIVRGLTGDNQGEGAASG
jgi:hypothetical protein